MGLCTPSTGNKVQGGPVNHAGQHGGLMPGHPYSGDPYEVIKVPKLPDLSHAPTDLQVFREQCAAGVRQAVAMVTAMEHQLWWERSRRQQSEEDVKVLLAAIDAERGLASTTLQDAAHAVQQAREEASGGALVIKAAELPEAAKAATVIQKNYRGHTARKDFEDHLRTILKGIDPDLDPDLLPATAQHHISAVNVPGKNNKGVRAALQGMQLSDPPMLVPDSRAQHLRQQVDTIKKKMDGMPDAGVQVQDPNLDTQLDLKRILQGNLPASSATVIAALVRRCRELQAALIETCQDLQQCRLAEQGLRAQNMQVVQLSQVRLDLEEERLNRQALQQQVAKLKHALSHAAPGNACLGQTEHARVNPHMAAWYRRQYAAGDFVQYPPAKSRDRKPHGLTRNIRQGAIGQGAHVFAGPDAEVELWDDLRACAPEPIMLPAPCHPQRQYQDLLALHADMTQGAARDIPNPLYTSCVPDTSQFRYARDTPIMPVSTTSPLVQTAAMPPPPATGPPSAVQLPSGSMQPPMVPVYSTLPLIREDAHIAATPPGYFTKPPTGTPQPIRLAGTGPNPTPSPSPAYSPTPQYNKPQQYSAVCGPAQQSYNTAAPAMTVLSNLPLLRESAGGAVPMQVQPQGALPVPGSTPALSVRSPLPLMRESTSGAASSPTATPGGVTAPVVGAGNLPVNGMTVTGGMLQPQQAQWNAPAQAHTTQTFMSDTVSSTGSSQSMIGSLTQSPARTASLAAQLPAVSGTTVVPPQYAQPPSAAFSFH